MNRTTIEWTDWTWNPITGCKNTCNYCYARKIAERFKGSKAFPNGFEPTYHPERLEEPARQSKRGDRIFVCSMGELFGNWIPPEFVWSVIDIVRGLPDRTFQFLTKQPQNLMRFSFPENCWVGFSATNQAQYNAGIVGIAVVEAKLKFVSFEPLLGGIYPFGAYDLSDLDWVIIGAQTNPRKLPKAEWVDRIIKAAQKRGIPIFVKNNLAGGKSKWQEFPR